jgi:protocatechuate 3,4-dioxygenase beta subunit
MYHPLAAFAPVAEPADSGSGLATRRTVLKAGAGALGLGVAGLTGFSALAQDAPASASDAAATATACVLTAELTEGPYYVEDLLMRDDITEKKAGIPLKLKIAVQETTACGPLAKVAVDIWHCDAQGYYSGISGENPGGGAAPTDDSNLTTTFLRGVQLTDADGVATFETIYPGWYNGRTIHIHLKVHVGGTADDTYSGGHVAHTGQLFFDDDISDRVFETAAYAGRDNSQRLRNDADNILGSHGDEPGFMLTLTPVTEGKIEDGFVGTITLGVDPNATPSATGIGGPPSGGQGGPPNGTPPSQ